jgi:hypothetical protein
MEIELTFDECRVITRGLQKGQHIWATGFGAECHQVVEMTELLQFLNDFQGCTSFTFSEVQIDAALLGLDMYHNTRMFATASEEQAYESAFQKLFGVYLTFTSDYKGQMDDRTKDYYIGQFINNGDFIRANRQSQQRG